MSRFLVAVTIRQLEIIFSQPDSTNPKYFYGVIIFTKTNRILALKRPQRHVNDPATMLIFPILRYYTSLLAGCPKNEKTRLTHHSWTMVQKEEEEDM